MRPDLMHQNIRILSIRKLSNGLETPMLMLKAWNSSHVVRALPYRILVGLLHLPQSPTSLISTYQDPELGPSIRGQVRS